MVKEGEAAPHFALPDAEGETVDLGKFKGHYVVLYFYPKDDTSGCTKEALDFTSLQKDFEGLKAKIIGISPDSVKSHAKFRDKHSLGITLLSDEVKSAIRAYGVWAEKKMYGKSYMGVERSTFLIGPDGKVLKAWRGVKVTNHASEVLAALKSHH